MTEHDCTEGTSQHDGYKAEVMVMGDGTSNIGDERVRSHGRYNATNTSKFGDDRVKITQK